MKTVIIATNNPGKFKEFRELFNGLPYRLLSLKDFPHIDIVEDGSTFDENAIIKAKAVAENTGHWAMADDSGLEVLALDGKPGVYSARYAGEKATDEENLQKLLKEMEGIPWQQRQARFACSLALAGPGGELTVVQGFLEGYIDTEARGEHGFGYDPAFFLPDFGFTLGQIGQAEKNHLSHRARAFEKMKEHLP